MLYRDIDKYISRYIVYTADYKTIPLHGVTFKITHPTFKTTHFQNDRYFWKMVSYKCTHFPPSHGNSDRANLSTSLCTPSVKLFAKPREAIYVSRLIGYCAKSATK